MGLFGNGGIFSDVDLLGGASIEKKRETKEMIKRAKSYVSEGENIIRCAYDEVNQFADETQAKLESHVDYKRSIVKELNQDVNRTISSFQNFHIERKIESAPIVTGSGSGTLGSGWRSEFGVSSLIAQPDWGLDLLDDFWTERNYNKAREQLDEAKRFIEKAKSERSRLMAEKEKLREICQFIDSERNEINALMVKIRKLMTELTQGMEKQSFTQAEADRLKNANRIAEMMVEALTTDFLTEKFEITSRYRNAFAKIQYINSSLPAAPSVKDPTTIQALFNIAIRMPPTIMT